MINSNSIDISQKDTQKQVFSKGWKIESDTGKIEADFEMYSKRIFDFGLRWTFFKVKKTRVQVNAATKLTMSL